MFRVTQQKPPEEVPDAPEPGPPVPPAEVPDAPEPEGVPVTPDPTPPSHPPEVPVESSHGSAISLQRQFFDLSQGTAIARALELRPRSKSSRRDAMKTKSTFFGPVIAGFCAAALLLPAGALGQDGSLMHADSEGMILEVHGPGMTPQWGYGGGYGWGPGMRHGYGPGMHHGYGPGMRHGYGPGMHHGCGQGMHHGYGPGMHHGYGPGMHQGWGPGMYQGWAPGMYGGWGPGMYQGWGPQTQGGQAEADRNLTVDEVRKMLEQDLAQGGNPRLKVGSVSERDADWIVAEILTVDDSLVQRLEVDRHSGWIQQAE
jgi:hypothetical protein